MAKNVTIAGASFSDVPAVDLPQTGGGTATFTDVSDTTAQAADVAQGKQFFDALGVLTQGTASGGGGASSWTKVAEKTIQYSTTSTSESAVETWDTGHSELWTSDKVVWVRIRDTEGKRSGYFYGSDSYLFNHDPVNGLSSSSVSFTGRRFTTYNDGAFSGGSSTYGIWASTLYNDGRISLRSRYYSRNSYTINSTYKIEVYLLDPAGGVSPFA